MPRGAPRLRSSQSTSAEAGAARPVGEKQGSPGGARAAVLLTGPGHTSSDKKAALKWEMSPRSGYRVISRRGFSTAPLPEAASGQAAKGCQDPARAASPSVGGLDGRLAGDLFKPARCTGMVG